ncbi:hypothetical protein HMPREF9005_1188 [Actinomyces sp. oral taxon 178 str. F0338]|nr:hypothetical protein HMPREF9005_1188 [Actinomyces sp. oral taxon 178 str. F0338]
MGEDPLLGRLIPARAGKTASTARTRACSPAHPRACGENWKDLADAAQKQGSSPRVRGKRQVAEGRTPSHGLIPARAGKTRGRRSAPPGPSAHPRACGENFLATTHGSKAGGSSPRVRGKLGVLGGEAEERGLIPARAGKTSDGDCVRSPRGAHPRACGENFDGPYVAQRLAGSSPRVRGKLSEWETRPYEDRLIPARAGKTRSHRRRRAGSRAHPRACGENEGERYAAVLEYGSSPRVRGKPSIP